VYSGIINPCQNAKWPDYKKFLHQNANLPAGLLPYKVPFRFKIPINRLRSTTFYLPFLY
jgi:hypothetical protein